MRRRDDKLPSKSMPPRYGSKRIDESRCVSGVDHGNNDKHINDRINPGNHVVDGDYETDGDGDGGGGGDCDADCGDSNRMYNDGGDGDRSCV